MKTVVLLGDRIGLRFAGSPLGLSSLTHRKTGAAFVRHGRHSLIVRTPKRVSDPIFLTRAAFRATSSGDVLIDLADGTGEYNALLRMRAEENGIRCDVSVSGPTPLWLVEWRLSGVQIREVVIPALGGQVISKRMPAGTALTYKYPFWWNAQFLLGLFAGGGMWLRTMEREPRFKLARIKRAYPGFDIALGFEADAPLTSTSLEATWYLDCFDGSWRGAVDVHRAWMEENFAPVRLEQNDRVPSWARQVTAILELWGIGKENPEPLHTFAQMTQRLREWAKLHPPRETLLYLPGFAGHGIDSRAPDYSPSEYLGGSSGFRHLVERAHAMGYRVMVHTNVLAMVFDHPLFDQFKEHQVLDAFEQHMGWGLDIDGDWLAEPYFAYIHPGVPAWGDLIERVLGGLITDYGVDAVFLDQTLLAFNVARGPNFVTGMRDHIRRLATAFPDTLFAGEGLHEQVLDVLPMAQIHGIDSIAEVHAMEGRTPWRSVHPVSTYLFSPYTRLTAHLLTKHPSHPMFVRQEAVYAALGVVPAVSLYHYSEPMDLPAVRRMLRRARQLPWRQL